MERLDIKNLPCDARKYRIACILHEAMQGIPKSNVCMKYKISPNTLRKYEEHYTTIWVLRTYQEAKDNGFLDNFLEYYIL